jgi:mono/diheme cytochrome c family protein
MKRIGLVLLVAGAAVVSSVIPARAQNKVDEGAALFTSQKCVMCHSAAGKGNPKGSLDGVSATVKEDEIRQWIRDPEGMRAKSNATRTPAMRQFKLTTEQVDALVAFITSLKPTTAALDAER